MSAGGAEEKTAAATRHVRPWLLKLSITCSVNLESSNQKAEATVSNRYSLTPYPFCWSRTNSLAVLSLIDILDVTRALATSDLDLGPGYDDIRC